MSLAWNWFWVLTFGSKTNTFWECLVGFLLFFVHCCCCCHLMSEEQFWRMLDRKDFVSMMWKFLGLKKKQNKTKKKLHRMIERECVCVSLFYPSPPHHSWKGGTQTLQVKMPMGRQYKLKLFKVKMPMEANHLVSSHFIVVHGSIPLGYIAKHVPH